MSLLKPLARSPAAVSASWSTRCCRALAREIRPDVAALDTACVGAITHRPGTLDRRCLGRRGRHLLSQIPQAW